MYRLPQIDPAEEQKRVDSEVRASFIIFGVMCIAIRLAPYVLRKLNA